MLISIVNHTGGQLSDEEVQHAIRAINHQIEHDYGPYWHITAGLRLEGPAAENPDKALLPELRGDAVIYLWNELDVPDALGYHDANGRGIPYGFVFTQMATELGEPWTVTFSHEALELIGDPSVNRLAAGPHPGDPEQEVFHWYEMCDAVQAESYPIDGIAVSNFVLPLYFTPDPEVGGRNDFLGRQHGGTTLESFGINPGGYVGFYNPDTGLHETFALKDDASARERLRIKGRAEVTRRSTRYTRSHAAPARERAAARGAPAPRAPRALPTPREVECIATSPVRPQE